MTIAIEDILAAEQLDCAALTGVRGGVATMPALISAPSPWEGYLPQFPAFPSGFPFTGWSPAPPQEPPLRLVDPQDPRLQ